MQLWTTCLKLELQAEVLGISLHHCVQNVSTAHSGSYAVHHEVIFFKREKAAETKVNVAQ
jgi:hypothetical protein